MDKTLKWTMRLQAIAITAVLTTGPATAQPHGKGNDKNDRVEQRRDDRKDNRQDDRRDSRQDDRRHSSPPRLTPKTGVYFADAHRAHIREYYSETSRRGHCPPGLAKRHNGCMPYGQAKKWQVGRPLPREVIYFEVPQPLVVQLGIPPAGYRYVRVAADILLIALGTGIVFDAIQDLGR